MIDLRGLHYMKILLITSGFPGIYPYLEHSIENAFKVYKHSVLKINPEYTNGIIQKVESFEPDLVLTLVGFKIDKEIIRFLQRRKSIRCIWLTEDPFYIDDTIHIIGGYDFVFTVDLGAFTFYKKLFPEKKIYHLPLGTDPSLYYPSPTNSDPLFDLCLVGYPYPERVDLVNHIMTNMKHTLILVGPSWNKFTKDLKGRKNLIIINKWVEPSLIRELFNKTKIILNPHRAYNFVKNKNKLGIRSKSINNRTFDIAACGSFQLLPNKIDLNRHFNLANEMVSYKDYNHCSDLIGHFINAEKERKNYSAKAYRRVLHNHTFSHRVQFILEKCK
jgi:spore maturation protein CgeB